MAALSSLLLVITVLCLMLGWFWGLPTSIRDQAVVRGELMLT